MGTAASLHANPARVQTGKKIPHLPPAQALFQYRLAGNFSTKAANNMNEIDEVIVQMNEFSTSVAGAITQQSAATNEIARNIEMAASGTNEVTQGISMVRTAATETGETASQLHSYAKDLAHQSELLDDKVAHFVGTIRTAW